MTKKYLSENTELMQEWDWDANEGLNPNEITSGNTAKSKGVGKCPHCSKKDKKQLEFDFGK